MGGMPTWLLCHPPLLSAAVLRPLARELTAAGHRVAVPDLRATVEVAQGWWGAYTRGAASGGPVDAVLGFSGAGVVLPSVAAAVGARRVVWVDAVVPVRHGATLPSADLRRAVAGLARDGRIPPWPTWWGPDAMADLLPDPQLRAEITAEAPALPLDLYDEEVPVPEVWPDADVSYVHLSSAYDRDAEEARRRGWAVVGDGAGLHTDVATDPAQVVDLLG
ncbi:hypothetical protein SAMN05660324_3168 [Klenkia brasiliensis]|uniref:Alpha/beta hydrolase family protein n=2 Tax=Klenkia brasiliensis TaxID=333142 RepID=A0A1G7VR87_9ACTN|nr:hypothetical protein SAMN05660324_3168 [Klenkia brasiliensis]